MGGAYLVALHFCLQINSSLYFRYEWVDSFMNTGRYPKERFTHPMNGQMGYKLCSQPTPTVPPCLIYRRWNILPQCVTRPTFFIVELFFPSNLPDFFGSPSFLKIGKEDPLGEVQLEGGNVQARSVFSIGTNTKCDSFLLLLIPSSF